MQLKTDLQSDSKMQQYLIFNGEFLEHNTPLVGASNSGLRYGDGLFETMKLVDGDLKNDKLHFERLFSGMMRLGFVCPHSFSAEVLTYQIIELAKKNGHHSAARVRLMVFRHNAGLFGTINDNPNCIIETTPLPEETSHLNSSPLIMGVYPEAKKSPDSLSSIKTNNFLLYLMAARYAGERQWNDAVVLNTFGRVADATTANIWWQKNGEIYTPPLSEGPIAGTVRRKLLELLPENGFKVQELLAEIETLQQADAIFITNAIWGIRWVGNFMGREMSPGMAPSIFPLLTK